MNVSKQKMSKKNAIIVGKNKIKTDERFIRRSKGFCCFIHHQ